MMVMKYKRDDHKCQRQVEDKDWAGQQSVKYKMSMFVLPAPGLDTTVGTGASYRHSSTIYECSNECENVVLHKSVHAMLSCVGVVVIDDVLIPLMAHECDHNNRLRSDSVCIAPGQPVHQAYCEPRHPLSLQIGLQDSI